MLLYRIEICPILMLVRKWDNLLMLLYRIEIWNLDQWNRENESINATI